MRPRNIHYGPKPKYPLATMPVGESFIVDPAPRLLKQYAYSRGLALGRKFATSRKDKTVTVTRIA